MFGGLSIKTLVLLIFIGTFLNAQNVLMTLKEKKILFHAIKYKDDVKIKSYLKRIEDLNFSDEQGNSVLMYAIHANNFNLVQNIVNKGVNVHHANHNLSTALHEACKVGNEDIVRILLDHHANLKIKDIYGNLPLFYANESGFHSIVALLEYRLLVDKKEEKQDPLDVFINDFDKQALEEMK